MAPRQLYVGLALNGNTIDGLPDAVSSQQPATYRQMLALFNGRSFKDAVRAASTGNIPITAPGATIDGVAMAAGDRFLAMNQTTASENGIYVWNGASAAAARAPDAVQGELGPNASVFVAEGSTHADQEWTLSTNAPITVGTTALTFIQTNGNGSAAAASYTAGEGISTTSLASNVIAVDRTKVPEFFSQTFGDGTATTFTINHKLNNAYPMVQAILLADGSTIDVAVVRTDANNVQLSTSGTAVIPANGARVMIVG